MILLITPSTRAQECAVAIEQATGQKAAVAANLPLATTLLRAESYDAVLLDQHLIEAEPYESETALAHLGTATAVEMNLAVSGVERVVRAVQSALIRRQRNETNARAAATRTLHGELSDTLTTLLVDCDLASGIPDLPSAAAARLDAVREDAHKLRSQLAVHSPEALT
jgi:hypothetical protein